MTVWKVSLAREEACALLSRSAQEGRAICGSKKWEQTHVDPESEPSYSKGMKLCLSATKAGQTETRVVNIIAERGAVQGGEG